VIDEDEYNKTLYGQEPRKQVLANNYSYLFYKVEDESNCGGQPQEPTFQVKEEGGIQGENKE